MAKTLEADYVVVGAGAVGMAFTDALIDHADVSVVLVDRRHGVGGHWLDAYPFVRLHHASAFYGVASTLLGGGRLQTDGPEAGLHERATAPEVCAYYDRVLRERFLPSGKVTFLSNCEYVDDGQNGTKCAANRALSMRTTSPRTYRQRPRHRSMSRTGHTSSRLVSSSTWAARLRSS
jgi:hypothetical protein